MRLIYQHITWEFIKKFILSMLVFATIYLVVDFFERIDDIIEKNVSLYLSLSYYLFKLPFIFFQVAPMAILVTTILTLGILVRNNEITAMKSCGVNIFAITHPIFLISLIVSAMTFVANEYIIPFTNQRVNTILEVHIKGKKPKSIFKTNDIWFNSEDNSIWNIKFFDTKHNSLRGVTIYTFDPGGTLDRIIKSDSAVWKEEKWHLKDGFTIVLHDDPSGGGHFSDRVMKIRETPDAFREIKKNPDEMSFKGIAAYVKRIREQGFDDTEYVVDMHAKLSMPLISLVMSLIGIPFATRSNRKGGFMTGMGFVILAGISYWILFTAGISLGHSGKLHPLLAAWGANLLFIMTGLYMFLHIDT